MMTWQQLLSGPTATLKDTIALRFQEASSTYATT